MIGVALSIITSINAVAGVVNSVKLFRDLGDKIHRYRAKARHRRGSGVETFLTPAVNDILNRGTVATSDLPLVLANSSADCSQALAHADLVRAAIVGTEGEDGIGELSDLGAPAIIDETRKTQVLRRGSADSSGSGVSTSSLVSIGTFGSRTRREPPPVPSKSVKWKMVENEPITNALPSGRGFSFGKVISGWRDALGAIVADFVVEDKQSFIRARFIDPKVTFTVDNKPVLIDKLVKGGLAKMSHKEWTGINLEKLNTQDCLTDDKLSSQQLAYLLFRERGIEKEKLGGISDLNRAVVESLLDKKADEEDAVNKVNEARLVALRS